jgi:hypothetical protein
MVSKTDISGDICYTSWSTDYTPRGICYTPGIYRVSCRLTKFHATTVYQPIQIPREH